MLIGGVFGGLVESPSYDLVSVRGSGGQVVKICVEIVVQVCALGENAGFSVERGRSGGRVDAVDELGGGCRAKGILPPC